MPSTMHPAAHAADRIEQLRRRDPALRRQLLEVRTWALANGVALERDGLTVVLGCVAGAEAAGVDPHRWTGARVLEFVWAQCPLWCLERGLPIPRTSTAALRQWWSFLADRARFTPGSDSVDVLLSTLAAHAGQTGRRSARPPRKHIGLP